MVISFAAMNVLFIAALTQTTAAAAIFLQYTGNGLGVSVRRLFLERGRHLRENLTGALASLVPGGTHRVGRRRRMARGAVP